MRGAFLPFFLFLSRSLLAMDYDPWLPPPWECKANVAYIYDVSHVVQSPLGDFYAPSIDATYAAGLGISPWPDWHVAAELLLTQTSETPFYQATWALLRYQWWDDVRGDPLTLTTGLALSFPGKGYLKNYSYAYHGEVNGEAQLTIGKELVNNSEKCKIRFWTLLGAGAANRGNGWVHGMAVLALDPSPFEVGVSLEMVAGLGSHNVIPDVPFTGYGYIAHRMTNVGGYLTYPLGVCGTLSLLGWYEIYARNFMKDDWGVGASLAIPFGF